MATSASTASKIYALLGLLLITFAAPAVSAFLPMDNAWYAGLRKPAWNPPSWIFGPVWSTLYTLMAVAAWLAWLRRGAWKPLRPYFIQLALNAAWSPVFFAAHRIDLALGVILLLWAAIALTTWRFFHIRRSAGALLLPYLGWVTFAAMLNFVIWRMNG